MSNKPTLLLILDGYGMTQDTKVSAISGHSSYMSKLMEEYPFSVGEASGFDVGLPAGQMGNSEVGHLNMGAGRVINQPLVRITKQIEDETFYSNEEIKRAIDNCKANGTNLHLYGLLSDGGVHSHISHVVGLLKYAKRENFDRVFIHAFLDGRDTAPTSGKDFLNDLQNSINEIGVGKIASLCGRYYVMDRDNRWDRVELAYNALVLGEGEKASSWADAINNAYNDGKTDEFVLPTAICENGAPLATISDNDSVIFFNFRPDRAREISRTFCIDDFDGFARKKIVKNLTYVCFTEYDTSIPNKYVAFKPEGIIKNTLAEYLSDQGLRQLHIAETEKYAHVTFFFNGGIEKEFPNEDRILIPSPKVATYDLKPEMSIYEVTEKLLEAIDENKYDFIVCNFANCDMVGHTGVMEAAQRAVEAVDECVKKVTDKILEVNGQMFVCADHGNAEEMLTEDGRVQTAHTTNKVPFIIVNYRKDIKIRDEGKLGDIAPTLLEMMGLEQPEEMTGQSLIDHI